MTQARIASGLGALLWLQNVQHILAPSPHLRWAALAVLPVYLLAAFPSAPAVARRIAAACAAAVAVLMATGSPPASAVEGLDFALTFMGFLPAITLVRLAFEADPKLMGLGARMSSAPGARSDSVMVLSHVSGAVMTLGTFAIVGPVFSHVVDPAERRGIALACLRGLCLSVLWTPFTVGMGFAGSHLPGVPLWQAMACGAAAAALGLVLSLKDGGPRGLAPALRSVRPLLAPVGGAALLLVAANAITGLSSLSLIMLMMPPLCFGWLAARAPRALAPAGRRLYGDLGRMGGEMLLFSASIAMGFVLNANPLFQQALAHTGLGALPPVEIMGVMVLVVMACALAGLHALVTGTIVMALAATLDGALSDLAVFTLLLFAWSTAAMLSVSSLAVAVTARTFQVPLSRVIYSSNLLFALALGTGLTLAVGAAEALARP